LDSNPFAHGRLVRAESERGLGGSSYGEDAPPKMKGREKNNWVRLTVRTNAQDREGHRSVSILNEKRVVMLLRQRKSEKKMPFGDVALRSDGGSPLGRGED